MGAAAVTPEIHKVEPVSGFTTVWGVTVNPMVAVLFVVICLVIFLLWKAQRDGNNNSFNVWDLLMDRMPDHSRKTSVVKTMFASSFVLSSWVVVDQEIKATLDNAVFTVYLATFCAPIITKMIKGDAAIIPTTVGGSS